MESLAYLHLALAYESPQDTKLTPVLSNQKFEEFKQCRDALFRVSTSRVSIYLLSLSIALAVTTRATGVSAALEQGDRGSEVTAVQQRLKSLGYLKTRVSGYFGFFTTQAVKQFQQARGLRPDGIVGGDTQAALFGRVRQTSDRNRTSQRPVESSENVRFLQEQLRDKGFYFDPIDGIYGSETERSVRNFQATVGLPVDGIAGSNTRVALDRYAGPERDRIPESNDFGIRNELSPRDRRPMLTRRFPNINRPYLVVVPGDNETLRKVRPFADDAFLVDKSRLGSYVDAGAFSNRARAESLSERLRSYGLDARVVYFR